MHYADFRTPHGIVTVGPFPTLDDAVRFACAGVEDGGDHSLQLVEFHDDPQQPDHPQFCR